MSLAQLMQGTIVILFYAQSTVAESSNTIDDINLRPLDYNSNNEGVVLVTSQNVRYGVCHFKHNEKNGNTWGEQEANVACKQLGYKGGWIIEIHRNASEFAERFVADFDCTSGESSLNNCIVGTASTDSCKKSRPAGVHCYSNFSVILYGGVAPNAGRVEVKYDDMWASVCYDYDEQNISKQWSFKNAQVVCKELGFPGTMFTRQGGQGQGMHRATIYGYRCKSLEYSSLHECFHDQPNILLETYNGPTCRKDNEAVVICAVPGYIGCFLTKKDTERTSHELRLEANNMTIAMCRHHCRDIGLQLACLFSDRKCLCRDSVTDHSHKVSDLRCDTNCSGGDLEACGGPNTMSVYNVNVGICDDPFNGTDIYYYGDIFSNFSCTNGRQLEGAKSIQCVMNASNGGVQWSDDIPKCTGRHWGIYKLAILVISSVFISSIFIAAAIMVACRKRKQHGGGGQEPTTDPFYDVIQYDTCDPRPRESSEFGERVDGFTKEERATCNASKEICQVCRNSYTEFRIDAEANGAACSSHYSDTCDEGWVQNYAYETSGSFHTTSG